MNDKNHHSADRKGTKFIDLIRGTEYGEMKIIVQDLEPIRAEVVTKPVKSPKGDYHGKSVRKRALFLFATE